MFHLVSLANFPDFCLALALACVCGVVVVCLVWLVFCLSLGKLVFNHKLTPVVDRPSLALVRQCSKKKKNLWCLFVVFSLPLRRRGGLCGTSLWHIVRPVLQCPSPPLRHFAWVLSSPPYNPFMTASLFSLSHAGLTSLWHIVRLVSQLSHLPSSSSLPPPYLFPIMLQSSLAPHQMSW